MNTLLKQEGPAISLFPLSRPAASPNPRRDTFYGQSNILEIKEMIREAVETAITPYKSEVASLKGELKELKKVCQRDTIEKNELNKLKEDIVKLECDARKSNLKFFGIRESAYETKFDCQRVILEILKQSNINLHPKALESAHRIGPKLPHMPRPITVRMFHLGEKEFVFNKAHHIWQQTGIRIEEDFSPKIEANRKILKPILFAANKMVNTSGKHEYSASLKLDKLNVNGRVYTVHNLDKLPVEITPNKLATQTKGDITAFFTGSSTLSNHHLATQKVGNKVYNCNEQFYMEQKALTFNDHVTAKAIMNTMSPVEQKKLGKDKKIANFKQSTWKDRCLEIMEIGLRAKFTQNPQLKQSLLDTEYTMLLEANPGDCYWGVGLSMRDNRLWKKNSWVGSATNHLGRLLAEIRRELR